MDVNQSGTVSQPDDSGASTVTKETTNTNVEPDRFKRDMLKYKDEAALLREKVASYELEQEQKKGNFEGVISSLKDEIKALKGDNANSKFKFAQTQLDGAIRETALSKGLTPEKVDVFMKLIDENDKGVVELDDSFNVNKDDVVNLVDKNMERYANIGLFGRKVKVTDATPNNNINMNTEKKIDMSKMSWDDAVAYAKTLKD